MESKPDMLQIAQCCCCHPLELSCLFDTHGWTWTSAAICGNCKDWGPTSWTNPHPSKSKSNKNVHKDPFKSDIIYMLFWKSGLKTISSQPPLLAFKIYQPLKGRNCSMKTTPWKRHGPTPLSISPCPVTVPWRLRCYSWEPSKPRRLWPPDDEPISQLKGQGNGHTVVVIGGSIKDSEVLGEKYQTKTSSIFKNM